MNSHLTSEEISNWLAGESGQEADQHLGDCPACRAELDLLRNAFAGFRRSLEALPVPAPHRIYRKDPLPRWILAAAALSLLIAAPVYWNARQQPIPQPTEDQAKADELLLERIQSGLSRSVPASMEPLMQLISNDGQREDQ